MLKIFLTEKVQQILVQFITFEVLKKDFYSLIVKVGIVIIADLVILNHSK